jgi:hypothetical protein
VSRLAMVGNLARMASLCATLMPRNFSTGRRSGRSVGIRGPVVIVKQGTGTAFGTANLVRVLGPLELDDLITAPELPPEERDELRRHGLPYTTTYAYVFTNPQWFEDPVSYRHPSGAVTWVRLPDLDLEDVDYVSPS